ncbi:hypothetical protein D9V29_11655 [Mycetocola manganoxydans]|uniref:Uncharacterized protein n=1 Tax=Mycetocola manganoxydans TaxID=699879 RepID=A0A3L6ZQL6_9MICO|nr:hypothetical protein [Mycetocola manganoxydans]RLP69372.1 hypothetical protein D9V29_11655 [Mycetocola manganoxydans]GHD50844.1 hypothetical protein GCM10008097_25270 [Mycetocola manganoxydans]
MDLTPHDLYELINLLYELWTLYRRASARARIIILLKRFIERLRKERNGGDDQKPREPRR